MSTIEERVTKSIAKSEEQARVIQELVERFESKIADKKYALVGEKLTPNDGTTVWHFRMAFQILKKKGHNVYLVRVDDSYPRKIRQILTAPHVTYEETMSDIEIIKAL